MRHRVKGRKLSRTASHRAATLKALATQLLRHKKIRTTVAKAKETKRFVEPLITKAKQDTLAARRHVARYIEDKDILKELFSDIVEKIGDRSGGYTRVVKLGTRQGDAAEMAIIELVDYNQIAEPKKKEEDKSEKPKQAEAKEEEVQDAEEIEDKEVKESAETEEVKKEEEPKTEEKAEAGEEKTEVKEEKVEDKKEETDSEKKTDK